MRLMIYIAVLTLVISCTSLSEPVPQTPCPLSPTLSDAVLRRSSVLRLAERLATEDQQYLVELLKMWGVDISEMLAYTKQLEVKAGCEK